MTAMSEFLTLLAFPLRTGGFRALMDLPHE